MEQDNNIPNKEKSTVDKVFDILVKIFHILLIVFLINVLLFVVLFYPTWPSKRKLCHKLEHAISFESCIAKESRLEILQTAFPLNTTNAVDVHDHLGEYFTYYFPDSVTSQNDYYIEYCHLDRSPIGVMTEHFKFFELYSFKFSKANNTLLEIEYVAEDW